jgi:hypothetical protein
VGVSCNHGDSGVGLEVWELETEDYGPGLLKFASRNLCPWVNYHLQKITCDTELGVGGGARHLVVVVLPFYRWTVSFSYTYKRFLWIT